MPALTPIFVNGWQSTVQAGSSAIGSASATGINVATGDGAKLPTIGTNQFIPMVVTDSSGVIKEYVWGTAVATDVLTVTRQAEDSSRFPASTTSIQSGYSVYAVASRTALSEWVPHAGLTTPRRHGLLAWTWDPVYATGATGGSAGVLLLASVNVPVTMTVTNFVSTIINVGSGLTAGQCFVGLYSSSGTLLGQSADQSSAFTSPGLITIPVSGGPITVTGGPDVYVYVASLQNGSTVANFPRTQNQSSSVIPNLNLATGAGRAMTYGSGQTSLPSSLTMASAFNTALMPFWSLS